MVVAKKSKQNGLQIANKKPSRFGAFTLVCSFFLFWNEILTILEILGKNLAAAGFHLG